MSGPSWLSSRLWTDRPLAAVDLAASLGYQRQPSARLAIVQMNGHRPWPAGLSEDAFQDLDNREPGIIPILRYQRSFEARRAA